MQANASPGTLRALLITAVIPRADEERVWGTNYMPCHSGDQFQFEALVSKHEREKSYSMVVYYICIYMYMNIMCGSMAHCNIHTIQTYFFKYNNQHKNELATFFSWFSFYILRPSTLERMYCCLLCVRHICARVLLFHIYIDDKYKRPHTRSNTYSYMATYIIRLLYYRINFLKIIWHHVRRESHCA